MGLQKANEDKTTLFRESLSQFVEKIRQDEQIIAAVLFGSLSYDQVWEKSDIDLKLIVHDQKLKNSYVCFVENDVPINASIQTRNEFKRWMERSVSGSFQQSMLVRSTLLFTKDASITEYFEEIRYIGERDRQIQLQRLGCHVLSLLAKSEKWLYVKQDAAYSAFWLIKMVDVLAQIEVLLHAEVPSREAVQQALSYNPDFFRKVYTELVCEQVTEPKVRAAIELVNYYLNERAELLFNPVLAYLKEEGDIRTVTDIVMKFSTIIDIDAGSITTACDWLAERGFLMKLESERKATPKSRIMLLEPAYLYEQFEEPMWEM
ncbi:nucleotidyltransferase domain-containing protein [Bacillus sp. FJAT-28004]|uniref:nucleotidyltransferase domain-containing protein n=1 Tax=Bacillus sp. FJAT-28004 TaxID=1679165 RepID=UPI0006B504C0|nr:nucleotidyltransferase domain-containing protein [Bacillus sp. FJAT-28004]